MHSRLLLVKDPRGHKVQLACPSAEKCASEQGRQVVDPGKGAWVPAGQNTHMGAPVKGSVALTVPAGQGSHGMVLGSSRAVLLRGQRAQTRSEVVVGATARPSPAAQTCQLSQMLASISLKTHANSERRRRPGAAGGQTTSCVALPGKVGWALSGHTEKGLH